MRRKNPIPDYTPYELRKVPRNLQPLFPDNDVIYAFDLRYNRGFFVAKVPPQDDRDSYWILATDFGDIIYEFPLNISIENLLRSLTINLRLIDLMSPSISLEESGESKLSYEFKEELIDRARRSEEEALTMPPSEKIYLPEPIKTKEEKDKYIKNLIEKTEDFGREISNLIRKY